MLRHRLFATLARPELPALWHLPPRKRDAVLARVGPDIDAGFRASFWPVSVAQAAAAAVLAGAWGGFDGTSPAAAFLVAAAAVSAGVWIEYLVVARHVGPVVWAAVRGQGHCPSCGYDIRATPDRCPECGAVPAAGL